MSVFSCYFDYFIHSNTGFEHRISFLVYFDIVFVIQLKILSHQIIISFLFMIHNIVYPVCIYDFEKISTGILCLCDITSIFCKF